MARKQNNYGAGRAVEVSLARMLARQGAEVFLSPGSKGACDIVATWPSGRAWCVQSKSSGRPDRRPSLKRAEAARVRRRAARSGSLPVYAEVTADLAGTRFVSFFSLRSGRRVSP